MPEQVRTFFISLTGEKKSVGKAFKEDIYFSSEFLQVENTLDGEKVYKFSSR